MNGGKGRGEADASASVNKFVKSPIIYKTIPPRKNAGYGPVVVVPTRRIIAIMVSDTVL